MNKVSSTIHNSVLLEEVINSLELKKGQIIFDGTLGGGGYAEEILKNIGEKGTLIGTDLDKNALKRVSEKLQKYKAEKRFFQKNYSKISEILEKISLKKIDRAVLDLGISSDQLEIEKRGISFLKVDEPLDMNLSSDSENNLTAKEILNNWSEESLADIFFYYGGERAGKKISKAIVKERKVKQFEKVSDLVQLIEKKIGYFYKNKRIHPATKIFQALRITVNNEIENLEEALEEIIHKLNHGGIISVVSFHSLEDRKVKKIFRESEDIRIGKRVNKKVITPSLNEVKLNPRSRSAKLRIFRKN